MQENNSQGGWQRMPGYHNGMRRDGGGYGGNSMCPPPHQRQMFSPHMQQQMQSGGGGPGSMNNSSMMTLSPHQMCILQRENPEAYLLIQQQRLEIYQHRVQLDQALKETSRLRKELDMERSSKKQQQQQQHDDRGSCASGLIRSVTEDTKPLVSDLKNDKNDGDGETGGNVGMNGCVKENRENLPPAINLRTTRSNSPSSQLTDTTQDSKPTKKRILEAAQNNFNYNYNNDNGMNYINNNSNGNNTSNCSNYSNNNGGNFHRAKKVKSLAKVAATLASVTSPLHKEVSGHGHSLSRSSSCSGVHGHGPPTPSNRRTTLPDIATVAARLSAATSPKFNQGNNCNKRHYLNSSFSF